ncbi:hypothetical protein HPB51_008859 [Rhipicephalus microplus]|uniref:Uncharacterized protein n=1 Tax=Rhipicephalus microplus TaxID=6941 RepID=A0A9J6ES10_RHIMP|nr:hypothetical protein HPB51_008859 [Rhipicephalus microplus]
MLVTTRRKRLGRRCIQCLRNALQMAPHARKAGQGAQPPLPQLSAMPMLFISFHDDFAHSVAAQVAVLQQKTWPDAPVADSAAATVSGDRSMEQLREVVNFLRREKELVAVRAEAAEAECARLTVQLEHRSASLRQAQQELRTEHERALARATSDAQHAELLRKVEMVQLLTESNRALRDERTELVDSKQQLEERCAQLERELGPLRDEVRTRVAQAEALQADVGFLRTEVQRWQQRTNQLLEQSSRTDPEAFRKLAEENTNLKREAHNRGEELVAVKRQLATYRDEVADYKQRLNAATEEAKAVHSELSSQIAALQRDTQKELQAVRAEADLLKAEAEKAATELQSLRVDKEEKLKTIVQVKKIARHYRSQFEEFKSSKEALEKRCSELEEAQAKAETAGAQARSDLDASLRQLQERQTSLTQELDRAKAVSSLLFFLCCFPLRRRRQRLTLHAGFRREARGAEHRGPAPQTTVRSSRHAQKSSLNARPPPRPAFRQGPPPALPLYQQWYSERTQRHLSPGGGHHRNNALGRDTCATRRRQLYRGGVSTPTFPQP